MNESPERLQQIFGLIKSGKMFLLRQYVETTNININEGDKEGNSAVAFAVQCGSKDVVEYLVNDMRAEVNTKNDVSKFAHVVQLVDSHFLIMILSHQLISLLFSLQGWEHTLFLHLFDSHFLIMIHSHQHTLFLHLFDSHSHQLISLLVTRTGTHL